MSKVDYAGQYMISSAFMKALGVNNEDAFISAFNDNYAVNKNLLMAVSHAIKASDAADSRMEILKAERISVPSYVSSNAARGLKLYEEGYGGDGLVSATISSARDMVNGSISEEKLRKIGPWIARHMVDLDAPKNSNKNHPDYPGEGLVAMLLWGAGPDKAGARRTMEWAIAKVEQIDNARKS